VEKEGATAKPTAKPAATEEDATAKPTAKPAATDEEEEEEEEEEAPDAHAKSTSKNKKTVVQDKMYVYLLHPKLVYMVY
jgi:hypothetical protein